MKYYFVLLFAFFHCLLSYSQQSTNVDSFKLISFGLNGISNESNAEKIIKEKWHIKNEVITGCLATEELIKSVKLHNDSVKNQIASIHGTDWESKFKLEIKDEEKKLSDIAEILNKDFKVIQKKEKFKGEEDHLQYKFTFNEKTKFYNISLIFNESEIKKLIDFEFDFEKKKYSIID